MSDDRYENVDENYEESHSNNTYNQKVQEKEKYNDNAIIGFICALVGIVFFPPILGIVAIIFSTKARKEIQENPSMKGDSFALAGLIIGIIELVLSILFVLFFLILATSIFI